MLFQASPSEHMDRLAFLIGRFVGTQELKLPGKEPFSFEFLAFGSRHNAERWLSLQFVAKIPGYGIESRHDFVTWDPKAEQYRWVMLSNLSVEPIVLDGGFEDNALVLISNPWQSSWGLTQLKATLTPMECGSWTFEVDMQKDGMSAQVTSLMAMPDLVEPTEEP